MSTQNLPKELTDVFDAIALSAQPEDIVADAFAKLSPAQKARFTTICETLRAEYEDQLDLVQLAMAALATVLQVSAMGHAFDVVAGAEIREMTDAEVAALEYARKLYNENVNAVLKTADNNQRESNFLRELDEFRMTRHADGSVEMSATARPKLSLKNIKVIDVDRADEKPSGDGPT